MSKDPRIQDAIKNWDANVIILAGMSDKKLVEKLDVINMQAVIAEEKKIDSSAELLEIWWRQVVEARIYKAENNIPDVPNEIELANEEVERPIVKTKKQKKLLNNPQQTEKAQPTEMNNNTASNNQLSLFE